MLKAIVTSFGPGAVGVTFESQSYGRTNRELPTFYLPCASREHATAVAKAYNGVAFTEKRPAVDAALVAADMAELERKGLGALNHHGEPQSAQYRGAPMGVADYTAPDVLPTDTLHFGIARIALDKGGYAPDGVYWGLPQGTLWHALATEHGATVAGRWFRAPSYAHAVAHVREEFPNATTQRVPAVMSVTSERVR